jgi:hypothetical protein
MSSTIHQYMVNLFLSIPMRRGPGLFTNASAREYCSLNN